MVPIAKCRIVFDFSCFFFCLLTSPAICEELPAETDELPFVITPRELNIKAESGSGVISKVITLDTGKAGSSGKLLVKLTPLRTSADYQNDLEPPKLRMSPAEVSFNGNGQPTEVLVSLQLNENLRYGEFDCDLVVFRIDESQQESEIGRIPVNLNVRDATIWPLVVLAIGVAAGVMSNWYRNKGQAKDEAEASIEELERFVAQEGIPEPFWKKVDELKADAVAAKANGDWASVSATAKKASTVILSFNRARLDWGEVWEYCQELRGALAKYRPITPSTSDNRFAADLQERFSSIQVRFLEPDYTPAKARQDLNALREKVVSFHEVLGVLKEFSEQISATTGIGMDQWRKLHLQLAAKFYGMTCEDVGPKLDDLKSEIRTRQMELQSLMATHSPVDSGRSRNSETKSDALEVKPLSQFKPSLLARTLDWSPRVLSLSRFRLKGYRVLGYVFPALVFIYTGVTQYYWSNATFGSVGEYVSLFLWGFAADASSNQVKDFIQRNSASSSK